MTDRYRWKRIGRAAALAGAVFACHAGAQTFVGEPPAVAVDRRPPVYSPSTGEVMAAPPMAVPSSAPPMSYAPPAQPLPYAVTSPPAVAPGGAAPSAMPIYPAYPSGMTAAPVPAGSLPSPPTPVVQPVTPVPVVARKDLNVRLRILNKTTAQKKVATVPMGTVLQYETLEIVPKRCAIDTTHLPARSSALLEIYERSPNMEPNRLFSGWMFSGESSLTHLEHPYYDVAVIECQPKTPPKEKTGNAGEENKSNTSPTAPDAPAENGKSDSESED